MHTATTPITPDNLTIEHYIRWLFEYADREDGIIALRGLTEKGTGEGQPFFMESAFADMGDTAACMRHALRWCEHGRGSFIVPAIVAHQAAVEKKAGESMMLAFTTILIDVDDGDTQAKLAHAIAHIGKPSMLVRSGGMTDAGKPKYHAYWRLSEPCWEVERVSAVRTMLAQKIGADGSFGRSTQVIRIPGTVHNKNNNPRLVEVDGFTKIDYHFDELAEAIEDMPPMPGIAPPATSNVLPFPTITRLPDGTMNFAGAAGLSMPAEHESKVDRVLTEVVHEGGVDGETRFDHASIAIGHEIRMVREGRQSREQALQNCLAWNLAKVSPPWPEGRVIANFNRLWDIDIQSNGAMPEPPAPVPAEIQQFQGNIANAPIIDTAEALRAWAVHRWTNYDPPPRRLLVPGFIHAGKRHMFASEGGAGKSNLLMDLAIKLVMAADGSAQWWMGQPITEHAYGGTVIILTGEDGKEELDHRWKALDPTGEGRRRAGDRLIAIPFESAGGAFPFVEYDQRTGRDQRTPQWAGLLKSMHDLQAEGANIIAVIVDTLNTTFHGEENSAEKVGEYIRAVQPITGELDAALIIAHHSKKTDMDKPVKTLDDMRSAVRGSSALINAMRVVIGLWPDQKYVQTMKAMGIEPKREKLYCAGVVKSNVPCADDVRSMMRDATGVLQDVTYSVQQALKRNTNDEAKAWIAFGIEQYADQQLYLQKSGFNALHEHIHLFHPTLHSLSRNAVWALVDDMLKEKRLIKRAIPGMGNRHGFLDTAANKNTPRTKDEGDLAPSPVDYDRWRFNAENGQIEPAV